MTENEKKYVIKKNLEYQLKCKYIKIQQGYLIASRGISLRLRQINKKHYITFKFTIKERVIEIENKISKRDFKDLWVFCLNKLEKHRYLLNYKKDLWEIDFFKDFNNKTYFAMAEIEMPEGKQKPDFIPKIIKDNLLYEVFLNDCRFSSKFLADVKYAMEIYETFECKSK